MTADNCGSSFPVIAQKKAHNPCVVVEGMGATLRHIFVFANPKMFLLCT